MNRPSTPGSGTEAGTGAEARSDTEAQTGTATATATTPTGTGTTPTGAGTTATATGKVATATGKTGRTATATGTTATGTTATGTTATGTTGTGTGTTPTGTSDAGGSPQLGVHAMAFDVDGLGHSPLTTPPVNTQASGSTFVLFVSYHQLDSVSDNMGNKYSQVGPTVPYSTEAGSFVAMYACVACAGGTGHTFSMNKTFPDYGDEGTVLAVEVVGASRIDVFAVANSRTNPISAGSVTTTQANDVLLLEATGNSFGSPD